MGKWSIPAQTDTSLRLGDVGVVVWGLQKQCGQLTGTVMLLDGVFGRSTEAAVKQLQGVLGVTADGVAGPRTQAALAQLLANQATGLPDQLLWSKVSYESGGLLGAVNWSVPGGVDCGVTQRRVYAADYTNDDAIQRAFDPAYQIKLSARGLRSRYALYLSRSGTRHSPELTWRTAVLAHNYPALADKISLVGIAGLTSYYTTPQNWVIRFGLSFPDGQPIRTPLQWGQRYSLGSQAHNEPGRAVRLVTSWEVA